MSRVPESQIPKGILSRIEAVGRRRRLLIAGKTLFLTIAVGLVLMIASVAIDWAAAWENPWARFGGPFLALALTLTYLGLLLRRHWRVVSLNRQALRIDRAVPELEERWSTAVELTARAQPHGISPELMVRVIEEADAMKNRVRAKKIVSGRPMIVALLILALAVGALIFCANFYGANLGPLVTRFFQPWRPIPLTQIEILPHPIRLHRDADLALRVMVTGRTPKSLVLIVKDEQGIRRIPLVHNEKGVEWQLRNLQSSFAFQVEAGDARTNWREVRVFDRPSIEQISLRISPPDYTGKAEDFWEMLPERTRTVEGSRMELVFTVDQELNSAVIGLKNKSGRSGFPLQLIAPRQYRCDAILRETVYLQVLLENEFGLKNLPAECLIAVEQDRPPEVQILETSQEVALSADDAVRIDFRATDDFGIARAELVVRVEKPGSAPMEKSIPIPLDEAAPVVEKSVTLGLKEFHLDRSSKISYAVRVQDNRGSSSKARNDGNGEQSKSPPMLPPGSSNDGSRTADSARKKIQIESFVSHPGAAALAAKQIVVESLLRALRQAAVNALERTESVERELSNGAPLLPEKQTALREVLPQLDEAVRLVAQLNRDTAGTPYAFVAMQTNAMVANGFRPAAQRLNEAFRAPAAKPSLLAAEAALRWVIATLDALTKEYVQLREVQNAAGLMQKLKEMHLVAAQRAADMELLQSTTPSPYQRSMREVEMDDELAKKLAELSAKRSDVYAQFARLLAQHPELQARLLDQSKIETKLYRDILLRLRDAQGALFALTKATVSNVHGTGVVHATWLEGIHREGNELAVIAADYCKKTQIWMPKQTRPKLREQIENAALAVAAQFQLFTQFSAETGAQVEKALTLLQNLEGRFLLMEHSAGNGGAVAYLKNRREDFAALSQRAALYGKFVARYQEGKFGEAVMGSQRALNKQTAEAIDDLDQELVRSALADAEIKHAIEALDAHFDSQVTSPQRNAIDALENQRFDLAQGKQQAAVTGLDQAVNLLDAIIHKIIAMLDAEEDKQKAGEKGESGNVLEHQVTLEDLLKQLELENRISSNLGIPSRPSNIMSPSAGGGQSPIPVGGAVGSPSKSSPPSPDRAKKSDESSDRELEKKQTAREAATDAAREAANAQKRAEENAAKLSEKWKTTPVSIAAGGTAPKVKDDWNTLPSALRANLLQERGVSPPKRYEEAIQRYFKTIAEDFNVREQKETKP